MRALTASDTLPPRLVSYIVNRLNPLWGRPLQAALVALTPGFGPSARLAVLAEAIELVADALRDGGGGALLPLDTALPPDDDTGYWARIGMALLIEMHWFRDAGAGGPAPTMDA